MPKAGQSTVANPLAMKGQTKGCMAASFIQQHMTDRYFDIGGQSKEGWVMQWCMDQIESDTAIPDAWLPSDIRKGRAESYAWQNVACDSRWPDQE